MPYSEMPKTALHYVTRVLLLIKGLGEHGTLVGSKVRRHQKYKQWKVKVPNVAIPALYTHFSRYCVIRHWDRVPPSWYSRGTYGDSRTPTLGAFFDHVIADSGYNSNALRFTFRQWIVNRPFHEWTSVPQNYSSDWQKMVPSMTQSLR